MEKIALGERQNLSSVLALGVLQNHCSPAALAGFGKGLGEAESLCGLHKPVGELRI